MDIEPRVLAALLTLLGVPRDVVMADYLRSNDYILPAYKKPIDAFVAAGGDAAIPQAILGVKAEYLDAAFDEMEKEYGTIEKYYSEGLGVDTAHQQAIRKLFLTWSIRDGQVYTASGRAGAAG